MAILNRAYPSIAINGMIVPQTQEVPFEKFIGKRTNQGNLGVDKAYIPTITDINSEASVGQQWGKNFARQSYNIGQIGASFYKINAFVEYDVEEEARFAAMSNGLALPDFLARLAEQGINQKRHQGILFGFDGSSTTKQGIINNATIKNCPADSAGVSTLIGYNTAEMQQFLSSCARSVMDATYGMAKPVVIASSSRVVNYLKSAIVSLTESQKDGAGIDSIAGLFGRVAEWLGVGKVEFIQDNLLENSDNGKDQIVFIARGLDTQNVGDDSMNLVGAKNSINYNTWYDGAEGLIRFPNPPTNGRYSILYNFKMTSGVTLRSEAVVVTSVQYS